MRTLITFLAIVLSLHALARPTGIRGTVTDAKGKPLAFALVRIGAAGDLTDKEGRFFIPALAPGEQRVDIIFSGLAPAVSTVAVVKDSVKNLGTIILGASEAAPQKNAGTGTAVPTTRDALKTTPRDKYAHKAADPAPPLPAYRKDRATRSAPSPGVATGEVAVRSTRYVKPLIEPRAPGSRTVLADKDIERMPARSAADAPSTSVAVYSGRGGALSISGGRSEAATTVAAGSVALEADDVAVLASPAEGFEALSEAAKTPSSSTARAGSLTSGESNDFSKWTLWEDMVGPALEEHERTWRMHPQRRYSLSVQAANGAPVVGAAVKLFEGSKLHWEAVTDNTGRAELWAAMMEKDAKPRRLRAEVSYAGKAFSLDDLQPFGGGPNLLKTSLPCAAPTKLDVAFIVDATGSMGDEISYLKAELTDILQKVQDSLPKLDVQTAAVFYQDLSDRYVTDAQDFKPGIAQTVAFIGAHGAEGGGDTPEAVDMALDRMLSGLTWREGTVAKIAFLVLDAPPHADPVTVARIQELTATCAARGIRLVPVACSGVDKSTEYLMRALALATNGTYLFLTNHSGIGGSHIEPTTDRYEVEYLNGLVYRVIHQFSFVPECGTLAKVVPDTATNNAKIDTVVVRWKFFPNPTTGLLNIEYDGIDGEFFVCDISGKAILRIPADRSGRTRVDLTQYPSGVYFLRYQYAPEKWMSGRFVVTH